ncbi:MAG: isoprenylcysteine carboxylmethyltransferase family protein, partial [Deferribacterales bacterium]
FLGIKQIINRKNNFTESLELKTDGILGLVRHPYYFAALILIWFRPRYLKDIILNIIFTIYFIVGAYNEERKLINKYGEKYIIYRKTTPMLLPNILKLLKYIKKSLSDGQAL